MANSKITSQLEMPNTSVTAAPTSGHTVFYADTADLYFKPYGGSVYALIHANTANWLTLTNGSNADALHIHNSSAISVNGNIDMGGSYILTNLALGQSAGQSVRYEQVLLLAGGTMAGNIAMGTNDITGVGYIALASGAAGTPALRATGDADTGIYWESEGAGLRVAVGGNLVFQIDAAFVQSQQDIRLVNGKYVGFEGAGRLVFADATPDTITVTDATLVTGVTTLGGAVALNDNMTVANTKDILVATDAGSDLGSTSAAFGKLYCDEVHLTTSATEYITSGAAGYTDIYSLNTGGTRFYDSVNLLLEIHRLSAGYPTRTIINAPVIMYFTIAGGSKFEVHSTHFKMEVPVQLDMDGIGLYLGEAQDASIGWIGATSIMYINPDHASEGTGVLYIGEAADDNIHAAEFRAGSGDSDKMFLSGDGLAVASSGVFVVRCSLDLQTGGVLKYDGTQVVGARVVDARIDDAINSGDATTDGVIDAMRDAMLAHGLMAAT